MTNLRLAVLTSKEIRQSFIDFFVAKGHSFVASAPVIPEDDPTLLFINAGMNQFKSIFLGHQDAAQKRAVNSQKCIRAGGKHNDLEEVGKDGYHHTFFEMLGNWSFGDYYKKDAIIWAWELLTEVWKLPKELLHATVHDSDTEACELWQNHTDIRPEQITFHGDEDNFWEMGETGPCGPCTEIHIDRGISHCNRQGESAHVCKVNGDCDRYIELWNLVFIQYNREKDGSLKPLKNRFVDTGAGLERIAQVLQDKATNYETDLFMPIIAEIVRLSGKAYSPQSGVSHRVIADHIRCLSFALADGGFPSNEGRGYVLRRILRRAARHGRLLGFKEPFLYQLVDSVLKIMGHHFHELLGKESYIKMVIKAEEERFNKTLDTGLAKFDEIFSSLKGDTISGKDVFTLYDTYGFPPDLTEILAEEKELKIDHAEFEEQMQAQRERARKASKFDSQDKTRDWVKLQPFSPTVFTGYKEVQDTAIIQRYSILEDGSLAIVLDRSPFYAESGGQVADTGKIYNEDFELEVHDVKEENEAIVHYGRLIRGFANEKEVIAEIDKSKRYSTMRNHTATHLLHKALRSVLGDHVQQKGSLVHPDYLRFDFTHFQALSADESKQVERLVNEAILENMAVNSSIQDIESAKKEGAIALFGEKYRAEVRVISIDSYSKELCGGTHANATGEIGLFKIISEGSVAAGIRRIEAYTGLAALAYVSGIEENLSLVAHSLGVPLNMISQKLESQKQEIYKLQNEVKNMQARQSEALLDKLLINAEDYEGYKLIIEELSPDSDLKAFSDTLKAKLKDEIAVIFSKNKDKLSILTVVGNEIKAKYHAGQLVSSIAALMGGKGGGRPDSAMAGSPIPKDFEEIKRQIPELIRQNTQ